MTVPTFSDYSVDGANSLNMSREIITLLGLDSDNQVPNNATKLTYSTSFPGYTRDDMSSMAQIFEKMDQNYQDMLDQIQTMNDLNNINVYVGNMYNAESTRMNHLKNSSVNNVYKARQQYSTTKYTVSYTGFITNAVILTLGVLIVCCVLGCLTVFKTAGSEKPMLSMMICACAVITIVTFYMIILALFVRQMMTRRSDDWDKRYFPSPPGVDAKASCNA
jgi:hypothetical protein